MSVITDQIDNQNFLSPVGFKFQIKKTPKTNYFVQAVNIPSVVVGEAVRPRPSSDDAGGGWSDGERRRAYFWSLLIAEQRYGKW